MIKFDSRVKVETLQSTLSALSTILRTTGVDEKEVAESTLDALSKQVRTKFAAVYEKLFPLTIKALANRKYSSIEVTITNQTPISSYLLIEKNPVPNAPIDRQKRLVATILLEFMLLEFMRISLEALRVGDYDITAAAWYECTQVYQRVYLRATDYIYPYLFGKIFKVSEVSLNTWAEVYPKIVGYMPDTVSFGTYLKESHAKELSIPKVFFDQL